MTVRQVADVTEEELEECESKQKNFDAYGQEFLYVKMTSRRGKEVQPKRSRWPTLDQLRPKLKRASLLETSLEEEQVPMGTQPHKPVVRNQTKSQG